MALRLVLLVTVWVSGASSALAQDESGGFFEVLGGSFHLDGSCVFTHEGACLSGLVEGDETIFHGFRIGYRSPHRWSVEGTVGLNRAGDHVGVPVNQSYQHGPPIARPGPFNIRLLTLGGTYSLLRRDRLDLYASASVGQIELERGASTTIRDLVTGVGVGSLVHVWRIVFLRGDLRGYAQWCSEERTRQGTFCDGGSVLSHLEASVGVQLVFHPYDL